MKILVPILVLSLLVLTAVFAFNYKQDKKAERVVPAAEVAQEEVVTGDPDDTVDAIIQGAEDEAQTSSAENDEAAGVDADVAEIAAMGDVYNDSEY